MQKGTLDEMVVRVVADLARIRLARLPSWVEVEQGDGLRSGSMRMRPIMEPRPILLRRIKIEGGFVFSGGIRRANTSHTPTQLHIGLLKFQAPLLEFVEERARLGNSVGNSNLQLANLSWGCEVTDNVDSVALLETNERGQQNFFSDVGYSWDGSHHPIHARTHTLELHVHLPSLRKFRFERGQLAISELRSDLSHSSNHKVETRLLIQCLELLL